MEYRILLFLSILSGVALGLTVGPVRLADRSYITYSFNTTGNNSLIECVYHLEDHEQLSRVNWELRDGGNLVGTYTWRPNGGGEATGRLKGLVELGRDDGALNLTQLRYDLSGLYSCGVELDSGEVQSAAGFEVLIVDINGLYIEKSISPGCSLISSFQSPTVFPEPTVRAGLYSDSLDGYHQEVSSRQWLKVIYPNKSVAYSYKNVTFEIDSNAPEDVLFKVSTGITKANGDYIPLGSIVSKTPKWNEQGCPDVKPGKNKDVNYFPGSSTTCRGGRRNTTKATITCNKGYIGEGDVKIVRLRCYSDSLTWVPEEGHTAQVEDLVCVVEKNNDNGSDGGDGSPSTASLSSSLLVVSLILLLFGPRHS